MAPAGQGATLSDVFCCVVCSQLFNNSRAPVSLICGHVICVQCLPELLNNRCPEDQYQGTYPVASYPVNVALLSIISDEVKDCLPSWQVENVPKSVLSSVEKSLMAMAQYLHGTPSEKGRIVFSEDLSRTLQRKLISLLCFQIVEEEGRLRVLKTSRSIAERILMELLLSQQNSGSLSTHLWTAVRARGCQFLGPAMQEDVLKLILVALDKGALVARKTLVMYVVQMLSEDYPQVSKTCVGHVVQLLYRASCFNVLKRDGESSLMQLKDEFRNYDSLRKEHDSQIVQMALECGLRISPDQWSTLLYGDQSHRSHMQSIINQMQTFHSYTQGVNDLTAVASGTDSTTASYDLAQIASLLRLFDPPSYHELIAWNRFAECLETLYKLIKSYVEFMIRRNERRNCDVRHTASLPLLNSSGTGKAYNYKTKMCRDISFRRFCPRGSRCSYAHNTEELRDGFRKNDVSSFQPSSEHFLQGHRLLPISSTTYLPNINVYRSDSLHTSIPRPSLSHPTVLPIPPVPLMISSPPHHSLSFSSNGNPRMYMLQPRFPHQGVIWSNTTSYPRSSNTYHSSQLSSIWNTHPSHLSGALLMHHVNTPKQPHQQFWMHTPPTVYTLDAASDSSFICSGPYRPELAISSVQSFKMGDQTFDTEQLQMKRNEIISRLAPLTMVDEDDLEDGGIGHVSYTVASSVLDDRGELHPVTVMVGPQTLELPPIPAGNLSGVALPTTIVEGAVNIAVDIGLSRIYPSRTTSIPLVQLTNVVTACPTGLLSSKSTPTATVQSDCANMQVKDTFNQPLPTPAIQRSQVVTPLQVCTVPVAFDTNMVRERIGTVMRPVALAHPQNMVSSSLDKIVDVKERLNEADGVSSTTVNQHLLVELRIAEREMDLLDPRTQASCLLRELRQVDRQIEAVRPFEKLE